MSLHRSFRGGGGMERHRNVLSRAERFALLEEEGKGDLARRAFGLPKLRNIKPKKRAKAKKAPSAEEGVAAAPTAGGAAPPAAGSA